MANPNATPEERRAYDAVRGFMQDMGYTPSIRELARLIGRSPSMARAHLASLQRKGYINRPANTLRVIILLKD